MFLLANLASAQTLEEAMAIAYENNPDLKSQREALKSADENMMQARAGFLPTVQASKTKQSFTTHNTKQSGVMSDLGTQTNRGIKSSATIKQNLFKGGGDIALIKNAKYLIEQQRAILMTAEQKTMLGVVQAYLNVAAAQMQLAIYDQKVTALTKYLDSIEARFKAGENTRTDVAQAKSYLSEAIASKIKAQSSLASAKGQYVQITTIEPENVMLPPINILVPTTLEEATNIALRRNPELVAAENQFKAADQKANIEKSSILPSADLTHAWDNNRLNQSLSNTSSVSNTTAISVTVPIFDGGSSWSKIRQTKRTAQQYKYTSLNTKQAVVSGVVSAWQNYESAKAVISAQEDAVTSARTAYEGMLEEEKAGTRSTVDVIVAQSNYYDSDIGLVTAKANNITNRYALKAAIGELTAKDLGLQVTLYDPLENYNKVRWELIGAH